MKKTSVVRRGLGLLAAAALPAVKLALESEWVRDRLLRRVAALLQGELRAASLAATMDCRSLKISGTNISGCLFSRSLVFRVIKIRISIPAAEVLNGSFLPDFIEIVSPDISWTQQRAASSAGQKKNGAGDGSLLEQLAAQGCRIDIRNASIAAGPVFLKNLHLHTSPGQPFAGLFAQADLLFQHDAIALAASIDLDARDFAWQQTDSGKELSFKGKVTAADFTAQSGQQQHLFFLKNALLRFQGSLLGQQLRFPMLAWQTDGFCLHGSCALSPKTAAAHLQSKAVSLSALKKQLADLAAAIPEEFSQKQQLLKLLEPAEQDNGLHILPVQVHLSKNGEELAADGSIEVQEAAQTILRLNYQAAFLDKTLRVSELSLRSGEGSISAAGRMPFAGKDSSCIALTAAAFPMRSLSSLLPTFASQLNGTLSGSMQAEFLPAEHFWETLSGSMTLAGWQGDFGSAATVENMDLAATAEHNQLRLTAQSIKLGELNNGQPLTIRADLRKSTVWDGTVHIQGEYADCTPIFDLFSKKKTGSAGTAAGSKPPSFLGTVTLLVSIRQFRCRSMIFSPLLLHGLLTPNGIVIEQGLLEEGRDNFLWLVGTQQGNEVSYEASFRMQNQPISALLALLERSDAPIAGMLQLAAGKLAARITPAAALLETVSGFADLDLRNGSVQSSSAFVKMLDLLRLDKNGGIRYDSIQGRVELSGGTAATDGLTLQAPAFSCTAAGSVDLQRNTLEMRLKIGLLEGIGKAVSSIPLVGSFLADASDNLLEHAVLVSGPLAKPEFKYLARTDMFPKKKEAQRQKNDGDAEAERALRQAFVRFMAEECSKDNQQ